jgi:hypothetical protein
MIIKGTDFVHSRTRAAVRVLEYAVIKRPMLGVEASLDGYICIYLCIYIYIYMNIYIRTYTRKYIRIHLHT